MDSEEVLLIALMVVTKDVVLAYADKLGIPEEKMTEEMVEKIKNEINQVLDKWRSEVRDVIINTLRKETDVKKITQCPLGLICYPSCAFMKADGCHLPKRVC
ncbi:hypothetical protein ACFLYQ_05355 [Chloroflexota bacterium]